MMRLLVLVGGAVIALALVASSGSACDAGRRLRDRIEGATPTPAVIVPVATPAPKPPPTPKPSPTPALPPNPQGLARWDKIPVHFCIAAGPEGYVSQQQFVETVERAFAAWGVPFHDDGGCGPIRDQDGVSEIGWGTLGADAPRSRVYEAGLTQTVTSECTADCDPDDRIRLTEADITIDLSPPREYRTAACLYSTLLHEAGHFLGLEHLPAPAVMAAQTSGCPTQLTQADRAALLARYGPVAAPQ